jgi:tRNA threonylcarbamoyladenosine biosynthesis protein TsaB
LLALAAAALSEIGNWKLEMERLGEVSNFQFPISNFLFVPMLDARRQEVWTAAYDASLRPLAPAQPLILENDLFENYAKEVAAEAVSAVLIFSGNGSLKMENVPTGRNAVFSSVKNCSARYLAALADQFFQNAVFQNVAYFEPFYMKPPNITSPSKTLI